LIGRTRPQAKQEASVLVETVLTTRDVEPRYRYEHNGQSVLLQSGDLVLPGASC
jgi:hypothetical protein